jgi:hypothetical protein
MGTAPPDRVPRFDPSLRRLDSNRVERHRKILVAKQAMTGTSSLTWGSFQQANYSFFDVNRGDQGCRFQATTFEPARSRLSSGRLLSSPTGSTLIRLDTGRASPLCASNSITIVPRDGSPNVRPKELLCSSNGTVVVYDWDSDRGVPLTFSATSGPVVSGQVVFWTEGQSTLAARFGLNPIPTTLCQTQASLLVTASADGTVVVLPCADFNGTGTWVAVDLDFGTSQTILAARTGSRATISVTRSAVGPTGRGVALA